LDNVEKLTQSLTKSTVTGNYTRYTIKIYIGIDKNDPILDVSEDKNPVTKIFEKHNTNGIFSGISVATFDLPPGSVCEIWRQLAKQSFEGGCDFIILLGDDIEIDTPDWMLIIHNKFTTIQTKTGTVKFGCVCFDDLNFPGFPTFPVLSRTHFEIFGADGIFPQNVFKNQDADPFLFQIYRRWNAAEIISGLELRNAIGGSQDARYEKKSADWTQSVLTNAVQKVHDWLELNCSSPPKQLLTVDVIIPSYRCDMVYLDRLLTIPVPTNCSTMFIVIVDDPNRKTEIADLLKKYEHDWHYRIRVNSVNLGAPASRNRGLEESSADWVLFLDDDVIPEKDLLTAYCNKLESVASDPRVAGLVGIVKFPDTTDIFTSAVDMSDLNYFYGIARDFKEVPWGVTANILVKRANSHVRFRKEFPRTGGGEDIDFALNVRAENASNSLKKLLPVPDAVVVHPWWDNGKRSYSHFYNWAVGDGQLVDFHPQYTYTNYPNVIEMSVFMLLLAIVAGVVFGFKSTAPTMLLWFVWTWTVEFVCDAARHFQPNEVKNRVHRASKITGVRKLAAALESCIVKNHLEVGHLVGHLKRGRVQNILKRFDWFAGLFAEAVPYEKSRALFRFSVWIVGVAVILARQWK
jgi:glycosyltransferase involved in cell wall biosynthesis